MEFRLDSGEVKKAERWKKSHNRGKCGKTREKSPIGGRYSYVFTPTSIGTFISIVCNLCGKEKTITDYDSI